jgi:hypothetical protein
MNDDGGMTPRAAGAEEAAMTTNAVLVRDRESGDIVRLRLRDEPLKLRLCRACFRAHSDRECPRAA